MQWAFYLHQPILPATVALTTLFGTAQLALQDALRRGLDAAASTPRAPNFVVVRLHRAAFAREFGWEPRQNVERLNRDLEKAALEFVAAHGWAVGGNGAVTVNVVLAESGADCAVEARTVQGLCTLEVTDDRGQRTVLVTGNPAIVGRAHEPCPRGFVALYDARKLLSREHLMLRYADLRLYCRKIGRNATTLNGMLMGPEEIQLAVGDTFVCSGMNILVRRIESA